MFRKIKIFIACWGTFIGIGILISVILVFFGWEDKIEIFFYLYFSFGLILVFVIFWPFYSKKME
jgi:hypothetical protein